MLPPAHAENGATTHSLVVTSIQWVRAQLTIRVAITDGAPTQGTGEEATFRLVDGQRSLDLPATAEGGGAYALHVNVPAFAERSAIPDGSWRIQAMVGDARPIASYDGAALEHLDDASRVFPFNQNRNALTVSFDIVDGGGQLDFLMHSYQLSRKPEASGHPLSRRLRERFFGAAAKQRYAGWIYATCARVFRQKAGRVLFASDQRGSMEGNLKRVHERMLERGLDKDFDIRTSFRLPRTSRWPTTIHILYLLATSEIVLLDDYFALLDGLKVDRRKRIIQLWHAGSGFKSVGFSAFGKHNSPTLWDPHRYYSYAIAGSEQLVPVYAEVFGIEESAIIPTGLPRVDDFLDEERARSATEAFYAEYPELRDKRIILFAPTYRGSDINNAFYDYSLIDFDALHEACDADTVVLFRMHHFVKDEVPIPERHRDHFFDVTRYGDGLGLLRVADLLITDYSSVIYEYSLLDRPMLFFAPDKVNYAAVHGFHRDYDETAPGRVCTTFEALTDAISSGDYDRSKVARFRAENFDRIDTGAGDRVIDWLILNEPHTAMAEHAARTTELHEEDERS